MTRLAGNYAIKARKLPLVMIETPLSTIQKGFAIKKGKPNLHAAVNKALAEMSPTEPMPSSSPR